MNCFIHRGIAVLLWVFKSVKAPGIGDQVSLINCQILSFTTSAFNAMLKMSIKLHISYDNNKQNTSIRIPLHRVNPVRIEYLR